MNIVQDHVNRKALLRNIKAKIARGTMEKRLGTVILSKLAKNGVITEEEVGLAMGITSDRRVNKSPERRGHHHS